MVKPFCIEHILVTVNLYLFKEFSDEDEELIHQV